jgi:hypothetical protein
MFTDYWVLVQLLTQICAWVLIAGASIFAIGLLKNWANESSNELQIKLERQSYLVSSLVQFVLLFQIFSLLIFLQTVNFHIPRLIKGAMCATGALGVNSFGYPILYLKTGGIFIYAIFLIINYLDNLSPNYPLTPYKYWLIFPAFLFISTDLVNEVFYFAEIKPDIIATCCSVNFLEQNSQSIDNQVLTLNNRSLLLSLFYGLGGLMLLLQLIGLWIKKYPKWLIISELIFGIAFVVLAVFSLKYFFVKYIYGVPNHNCLFDIFFPKYYYLGYALFSAYYGLIFSLLLGSLGILLSSKIPLNQSKLLLYTKIWSLFFIGFSLIVPSIYWFLWQGNL